MREQAREDLDSRQRHRKCKDPEEAAGATVRLEQLEERIRWGRIGGEVREQGP